jgi:hypothetical protein
MRRRGLVVAFLVTGIIGALLPIRPLVAAVICTPLGTLTPRLALCKPVAGEINWTNAINNNWTLIDAALTGTANQVIGVTTTGTGVEGKTITGGPGITISPSAGQITISTQAATGPVGLGTSRVSLVSPTQIQIGLGLIPLKVGVAFTARVVTPVAPCSNTGLATLTRYYVYAFDNSGATVCEISATTHVMDSVFGVEVKSGDQTRTLVGMVYTNAAGQFENSNALIGVRSFFNRGALYATTNFAGNANTTLGTFVELNSSNRIILATWGGDLISLSYQGSQTASAPGITLFTGIAADTFVNSLPGFLISNLIQPNGGNPAAISGSITLAEGIHTFSLVGAVSGGTGVWHGNPTNTAPSLTNVLTVGVK